MPRTRLAAVARIVAFAVASAGAGAAIAACGSGSQAPAAAGTPGGAAYSYYRSMMGRLDSGSSGMMGGASSGGMMTGDTSSRSWMMGDSGYDWVMGGQDAPAWMSGSALPGYMMGTSSDPGQVMGALFADAPGARVSPGQADRLGSQLPAAGTASDALHRITFSGMTVRLAVVASPAGGREETFRIAGMVNPAIVVNAGAHVSVQLVNADPGAAQGLVITAAGAGHSSMPMMTAHPAFAGAAVWFLGDPTSAGMHTATLSFTATAPGTYQYLSPVPGHALEGMTGTFTVSGT
jgi:hypothetical protein